MQRLSLLAVACAALLVARARAQFPNVPVPPGNPITANKTLLGKALFWDEQLSSTRMTACGTCHEPKFGMGDGRGAALGAGSMHPGIDGAWGTADDKVASRGPVTRNAQGTYQPDATFGLEPVVGVRQASPIVNAAFFGELFWDGRADDDVFRDPITNQVVLASGAALENLCIEPPLNDQEMAHVGRTWADVVARVQSSQPLALSPQLTPDLQTWIQGRSYPQLYNDAFGTPQVTAARTIMALATYMRTLVSDQSRFDQFMNGNPSALTAREQSGFQLFQALRCDSCHTMPLFSDGSFHDTGVRPLAEDAGRGGHTNLPADDRKFRTPTLRNVALRAPFFHNGGKQTLEDVVDFYFRGGDFPPAVPEIFPFPLGTTERDQIVAFLKSLTDPRVQNELPPFDRPALASANAPVRFGTATAGSGGFAPRIVAFEPPAAGNPEFTVGIDRALGGAPAFLGVSPAAFAQGVQVAGASVHVDPGHPVAVVAPLGALGGGGAGNGFASFTLPIPANSTLTGTTWHFQWFVVDAGAAGGIAATAAATAQVF